MQTLKILLICSSISICYAGENTSIRIRNNAPSLDEEYTKSKVIFQLDNSIYHSALYQSYALTWYAPYDLQIGIQSLNYHLQGIDFQSFERDTYFTLSKSFDFDVVQFSIGNSSGTNFDGNTKHLHNLSYADLSFQPYNNLSIDLGLLYANKFVASLSHDVVNFHFGTSYKNDYTSITLDYYSGNNNASGIMTSISFRKLFENFRPYIGIQASTPYEWANVSGSIGFTYKLF